MVLAPHHQNNMLSKFLLRCEFLHKKGVHYCIENPMSTLLWSYRPMEAQLHTHTHTGETSLVHEWSGDFLLSFHPSCNLLARRCWRGTIASRSACHWEPTAEWARDLTASSLFEIETGDVRVFVPASLDACISKEACDFIHNCPISFSTGNEDRPFAKARLLNVTWFILIQTWSVSSLGFYWPLMLMCNTARERLARMKSHFNVKLVKRYRDKRGQQKIKGSRDLAKSAEYPIQLGLKAGLYVYVTWVSTAYIYIYIYVSGTIQGISQKQHSKSIHCRWVHCWVNMWLLAK